MAECESLKHQLTVTQMQINVMQAKILSDQQQLATLARSCKTLRRSIPQNAPESPRRRQEGQPAEEPPSPATPRTPQNSNQAGREEREQSCLVSPHGKCLHHVDCRFISRQGGRRSTVADALANGLREPRKGACCNYLWELERSQQPRQPDQQQRQPEQ